VIRIPALGRRRRRQTQAYADYLLSPQWQQRRRQIIRARGRRCQRCGSPRRLQLHHKTYLRLGHERDADLELLCPKCHTKADRQRARDQALQTYIHKKYGDKYGDKTPRKVKREFAAWLARKQELLQ
jgi:5-methylcytosine-specific restriction endonuclease McrA